MAGANEGTGGVLDRDNEDDDELELLDGDRAVLPSDDDDSGSRSVRFISPWTGFSSRSDPEDEELDDDDDDDDDEGGGLGDDDNDQFGLELELDDDGGGSIGGNAGSGEGGTYM
jgi:hypothetical protein